MRIKTNCTSLSTISVTRFGEISPQFWPKIEVFEGLQNIWQKVQPDLANLYAIGRNLIDLNGQILKK